MKATQLLESIWEAQPNGGYVFTSSKRKGNWRDLEHSYPGSIGLPSKNEAYFCPTIFRKPRRVEKYATASRWLHADLDEVDPHDIAPRPTLAWETSEGRFQALWLLTRSVSPEVHARLNQHLNYYVEADRGGWSITKVLRIPGTYNVKYDEPFRVKLLWDEREDMVVYDPKEIWCEVKHVDVGPKQVGVRDLELPDMTFSACLHKHRSSLPKRALRLLQARSARIGERSDRLWELERLLVDVGVPLEEVLILVRETVWNKYSGQRREVPQLWKEIQKAGEARALPGEEIGVPKKFVSLSDFMTMPLPKESWAVESIWTEGAHGLLAGEPKTYKSLIGMDLAVSVASGTRFLGEFDVPKTGPVIVIQEENTDSFMRDRIEKIFHSRGLQGKVSMNGNMIEVQEPEELPLKLMNRKRFLLTDEDDMEFLRESVASIKPALVVLDPLYLMIPGLDESNAKDITPVLLEVLRLKQEYGCGILLVHHFNKPRQDEDRRAGHRIHGTGVFYRWFESALYTEWVGTGEVKLYAEHRNAASTGVIKVGFDMGPMGDPTYNVDVEAIRNEGAGSIRAEVLKLVGENPGITADEVGEVLGCSSGYVRKLVGRLNLKTKAVQRTGKVGRPTQGLFLK